MQNITKHLKHKKNDSMRRFFSYIGKRAPLYWFQISLAVIGNAILTVLLAYVNYILFQAVQYQDFSLFRKSCLIGVLILVISFFYPFTRYVHIRLVRVMIYDLKLKMFTHLTELDQSYMDIHHSGDAIQRIGMDAESLKTAYFTQVYVLCNLVVGTITALVNMFLYHAVLSIFSIVCCAVTVYLSSILNKEIKKMSTNIQKKVAQLTEKISNCISGFLIIKIFEGAGKIIEDFEENNENVTKETMRRTKKLSYLQMVTFLTGMVASLGSVLFGAWLVYLGKADFGIVMAVVSLQINVSQTMQRFGVMLARFHASLAQADRVFDFLELPPLSTNETGIDDVGTKNGKAMKETDVNKEVHLQFQDVTFAYPDSEPVMEHFNLAMAKNQKVIVTGPSGKGKSTLIKMLLGLYPYQKGSIRLDGREINQMNKSELRNYFSYVPQNSLLFEGTIMENIRFAKPDATDAEVIHAARLSFADEFIMQMPQLYQSRLVMGGTNLSGGQRQRIALARAFLKDAPILLLDEITSALDTESEEKIMKAVDQMKREKTIVMITHRLAMAGEYDMLVQM